MPFPDFSTFHLYCCGCLPVNSVGQRANRALRWSNGISGDTDDAQEPLLNGVTILGGVQDTLDSPLSPSRDMEFQTLLSVPQDHATSDDYYDTNHRKFPLGHDDASQANSRSRSNTLDSMLEFSKGCPS